MGSISLVPRLSVIISVGGKDGLVYTVVIVQCFPRISWYGI